MIRISFKADPDPDPSFKVDADPDPGIWWPKIWNFLLFKKSYLKYTVLIPMPFMKEFQTTEEASTF